jgi:hypothetical protein
LVQKFTLNIYIYINKFFCKYIIHVLLYYNIYFLLFYFSGLSKASNKHNTVTYLSSPKGDWKDVCDDKTSNANSSKRHLDLNSIVKSQFNKMH